MAGSKMSGTSTHSNKLGLLYSLEAVISFMHALYLRRAHEVSIVRQQKADYFDNVSTHV